ncbi:MAG: hypothetical protein V4687_00985 [Bacteroidota bacterium]
MINQDKTITKTELSEVLIDVRKAYRLLYLYQRRVLDTIKYIADVLSLKVRSGWTIYGDQHPKNGAKLDLDLWAWDWLTMYMYEFYFGVNETAKGNIQFAIIVQSDTGSYDSDADALEIDKFAPVEISATKLIFILGLNTWKNQDDENLEIYSKNGNNEYVRIDAENKIFLMKSYDLGSFINDEGVLGNLRDFISFAESNEVGGFFSSI